MWLIDKISTYFRTRRHAKEYKKIQQGLLDDPKLLFDTKVKFEKSFGKDQNRTRIQWRNLVRVYGMETVCMTEKMSEDEIIQRCRETFSQKVLRELTTNKN